LNDKIKAFDQSNQTERMLAAILRAVLISRGGKLHVSLADMPDHLFTIVWHPAPDGGFEVTLEEGSTIQ
jgi:hypothetical protein